MFPQPGGGGKAIHESGLLKIQTTYIIYNNIYNIQYIKQKVNQKNHSFQQRNVILKISHDFEKQNALQREKALHALSERDMIHLCRKVGTGSAFIAPGLLCCQRRGKM